MFDWTKFTDQLQPSTNDVTDFRKPFTSFRAPLKNYSLIVVEGPDAEKFLQGQCTCDFTQLNNQQRLLGAHCDHKGRMQTNFVAAKLGENKIGLRVHESVAEQALHTLKKYSVFSKATIDIGNYALLGLGGSEANNIVAKLCAAAIPPEKHFFQQPEFTVISLSENCYEIWFMEDVINGVLKQTVCEYNFADDNIWLLQSIQRGEAIVTDATANQLLPQEINMQFTGGISFDKGCYTGQEIIARLHYKGQMKKHLYRGTVNLTNNFSCKRSESNDNLPLAANIPISSNNPGIKGKGFIVNCVRSSLDSVDFLALCDDNLVENNAAVLLGNSSAKIQWLPLPYAIN